jgi:hypothetical protein
MITRPASRLVEGKRMTQNEKNEKDESERLPGSTGI